VPFCAVATANGMCGGGSSMRTNEKPYVLSAAAWPVLVLDCSGRYVLVEPGMRAPCGLPKEAGARRAGPAGMNRSQQGLRARASELKGSSGR
jgi:hypothetical protein